MAPAPPPENPCYCTAAIIRHYTIKHIYFRYHNGRRYSIRHCYYLIIIGNDSINDPLQMSEISHNWNKFLCHPLFNQYWHCRHCWCYCYDCWCCCCFGCCIIPHFANQQVIIHVTGFQNFPWKQVLLTLSR